MIIYIRNYKYKKKIIKKTQIVGEIQIKTVHSNIKTGNKIKVVVKPHFSITKLVPNNENKKDIEFVAYSEKL
jgi:hypothetical protein